MTIDTLVQDIRFAVRILGHAKLWAAVIILSLGLGIGANTLSFSLVNGILFRTLNVAEPEGLVRLRWSGSADLTGLVDTGQPDPATGHDLRTKFPEAVFEVLRADGRHLRDLTACGLAQVIVLANGDAAWADGLVAAGNYYEVLGIRPTFGRFLTVDDDKPESPAVGVISYGYWTKRFNRDTTIIGQTIRVNDFPITIIGIEPEDFKGIQSLSDDGQDITFPLSVAAAMLRVPRRDPTVWNRQLMGRLNSGVTAQDVQRDLNSAFQDAVRDAWTRRLATLTPAQRALPQFQTRGDAPELLVESGKRGLFDSDVQIVRTGFVLIVAVGLLLLMVCANVTNLMLSRCALRRREISVRLSLGAPRRRVMQQLLTESFLLAASGAIAGLAVNHWGRLIIPSFRSAMVAQELPAVDIDTLPAMDWRIFAFMCCITCVTAIAFGLGPAFRATRVNVAVDLKENGRGGTARRLSWSNWLLIAQISVSIVLLVGAGLLLQTVENLRNVPVGFNPKNVLTFHISLRAVNFPGTNRMAAIHEQITERLARLPGVVSVGGSSVAFWQTEALAEVPIVIRDADPVIVDSMTVSPGFFETMQVPRLAGRAITERDLMGPPTVVVLNEAAARKFFAGDDLIGQRIGILFPRGVIALEVIAVMANAKYGNIREPVRPAIYIPAPQTTFMLRTEGDPMRLAANVREIVRDVEPLAPITDLATQEKLIEERIHTERLFARFYTFFAVLALILASIGLFGLMSYQVARRTREIGVRMALGARRGDVLSQVMRESVALVGIGIVVGVLASLAASRLIAAQLYEVRAFHIPTLTFATTIMLLVAVAAAYLPARRASRVDPLQALRHD